MSERPTQYIRICEFVHRYPHDFSKPAQFAGGEHVILIRKALLSYNTLTARSLMANTWSILPQRVQGTQHIGDVVDADDMLEQGLLRDVSKYPVKEYANYEALIELLKAKFLCAQKDATACRTEAQKHAEGSEPCERYTSYADSFQTASLLIADALDSIQVGGT